VLNINLRTFAENKKYCIPKSLSGKKSFQHQLQSKEEIIRLGIILFVITDVNNV